MSSIKRNDDLGRLIRLRRRALGLSQDKLARSVDLSPSYISHLESGRREVPLRVLLKLRSFLGLDSNRLLTLANLGAETAREHPGPEIKSQLVWEEFVEEGIRVGYDLAPDELRFLLHVAKMGEVRSARDLFAILQALRVALDR